MLIYNFKNSVFIDKFCNQNYQPDMNVAYKKVPIAFIKILKLTINKKIYIFLK